MQKQLDECLTFSIVLEQKVTKFEVIYTLIVDQGGLERQQPSAVWWRSSFLSHPEKAELHQKLHSLLRVTVDWTPKTSWLPTRFYKPNGRIGGFDELCVKKRTVVTQRHRFGCRAHPEKNHTPAVDFQLCPMRITNTKMILWVFALCFITLSGKSETISKPVWVAYRWSNIFEKSYINGGSGGGEY